MELTRGAKGEYRWVVKSAATNPSIAVRDVVAMDTNLRNRYYPEELKREFAESIKEVLEEEKLRREKEESDAD